MGGNFAGHEQGAEENNVLFIRSNIGGCSVSASNFQMEVKIADSARLTACFWVLDYGEKQEDKIVRLDYSVWTLIMLNSALVLSLSY